MVLVETFLIITLAIMEKTNAPRPSMTRSPSPTEKLAGKLLNKSSKSE